MTAGQLTDWYGTAHNCTEIKIAQSSLYMKENDDRVSKSCRLADAQLKNLCKIWTFKCKTGKSRKRKTLNL